MGAGRGKLILIAIFVGIVVGLAALITFTTIQPTEVTPNISITLHNVTMSRIEIDDPTLMTVKIDFTIANDSAQTFTLSTLDYDLYANELLIGRGGTSLEDIPLSGRAPLRPGFETTLPSEMKFRQDAENKEIWDALRERDTEQITWRAEGQAQVESAFSIVPVDFKSTL